MTTPNDPPSARPGGRQGQLRREQPHGGQSFGQPPQPGPPYRPAPSGALVAAAVIQIVQSAIWIVVGVAVAVVASVWTDLFREAGISGRDAEADAFVIGLMVVAVAVAMLVLALRTMRLRNGSRIASIVLQTVFAVLWMLIIASSLSSSDNPLIPLLVLASCIAVVALLLTASARTATARRD